MKEYGPAFPQPCTSEGYASNNGYQLAGGGISMRDYFAAHAPYVPAWFVPTCSIEPDPERPKVEWCEGCKAGADCDTPVTCKEINRWTIEREKVRQRNKMAYAKAACVQWPWVWADAVLAEQTKETA